MSKFQPYPEYKDTDFEWLGAVPVNWGVYRLGQYFEERKEKVSDTEYPPLSVTKNGIVPQLDNAAKSDAGDNRKRVAINDFVINSRSDRKGSSGVSVLNGSVSLISIVLKPRDINPLFVHYLLRSYPFQEEFYRFGSGIVADLWSTNYSKMKNINIPIPSVDEQTQIATFLNRETTRIDTLIQKKTRFIELLKEKRQALISHAVTKGLDPNVPMKDSGVEWLGDIPAHWNSMKFRFLFSIGRGLSITKENLQDTGIPCVNYGEIHSKYGFELNLQKHPLKCVGEEYLSSSPNAILSKGDVVFADTSEDIEGSGNFTQLVSKDVVFAGYHTVIARSVKKNNDRYLAYVLDSNYYRSQIRKAVKGIKVFSITQAILKDTILLMPDLSEQTQIATFLDRETARIDTLIEKTLKSIGLIKEHRTSLISAAVTGKIDVRPPALRASSADNEMEVA